ncbi:hypothetical protein NIES2104_27690 [Leptolyngbya sp. NIES-2104]|nr:hypothetical protein NIES2104_27690 [Leptolyngbya sp. NIES-2104]
MSKSTAVESDASVVYSQRLFDRINQSIEVKGTNFRQSVT